MMVRGGKPRARGRGTPPAPRSSSMSRASRIMNSSAPSWWNSFLTTGAPPHRKIRAQPLPPLPRKEPPSRVRISSSLRKGMRRPRKSMSPSRTSTFCQMRRHIQQTMGRTATRHSKVCRGARVQAPTPPCRDLCHASSSTITHAHSTMREGPLRRHFPRGPLGRHCPVDLSLALSGATPPSRKPGGTCASVAGAAGEAVSRPGKGASPAPRDMSS
ncbi:hypothetical protein E2C01_092699 [Portunus trituberculatus]|uniref:Uncharacterized protein n=1 Tax=Portunus trituberculatus TaxID=210409 RepID=A0A5B7JSW0_PORTR|nr:hypothetical protein [Portunus trituberculatus]